LHSLGFFCWFDKIHNINTVVLNPRWITGAVYKIINWVSNPANCNNASITRDDFNKALRASPQDAELFPQDKDDFIFEAMKSFELAYSEDSYTLVVPHCLKDSYPDNVTKLEFNFENSVQIEFNIMGNPNMQRPEFPKGAIPRFIVKNYNLIHKENNSPIISLNGAMFNSPDGISRAEIKKDYNDNYRISIIVQGRNIEKNIEYLTELSNCLNQILAEHERFQKQKPKILYYATDVYGEQIPLSLEDLQTKSVEEIENYNRKKLNDKEPARVNLIIINLGGTNIMEKKYDFHGPITQLNIAEKGNINNPTVEIEATPETIQKFSDEVNEAKKIINDIMQLEEREKKYLIEIIQDAQNATKNNNEDKKASCKRSFVSFIRGLSNAANEAVLPALANLATIAAFFGIVPVPV